MIDSKIIDAFIRNPDSISVKSYHSIAKIISALENGFTIPHQFFNGNTAKNENCVTVGITGGAGAGKSSFINKLISYIVQANYSVGIVLIDPSSKLTKGTLLGDRIRINPDYFEKNVYIRSLSTLDHVGNIPSFLSEVVQCMKIIGFDFILIETIGIGQNDDEIKKYVEKIIYIPSNENFDWIQQHKSSVHDITDIYFINKNDIHDTNRVKTSIEEYLELMKQYRKTTPAIFCGNAINGEGIEEVYKVLSKKLKNGSNIE